MVQESQDLRARVCTGTGVEVEVELSRLYHLVSMLPEGMCQGTRKVSMLRQGIVQSFDSRFSNRASQQTGLTAGSCKGGASVPGRGH